MQYFDSKLPVIVLDSNFLIKEASEPAMALFDVALFNKKATSPAFGSSSDSLADSLTDSLKASENELLGKSIFDYLEGGIPSSIRIPAELRVRTGADSESPSYPAILVSSGSPDASRAYLLILGSSDTRETKLEDIASASSVDGKGVDVEKKFGSDLQTSSEIQSSKLEALGTLAGGIAHDLNNLLMAVLGHLSYLRISNADMVDDSLRSAEEGARMAARLSQQILDFARRQQVSHDQIDICKAITSAIPLFSPSLPEGIQVSFKSVNYPMFVCMDESQVTQIVLNLLVNARDAMGPQGRIAVELDRLTFNSGRTVNGFTIVQGDYARVLVKDTGHGMTDEIKGKIFEPFFTTKRGTGTGLGLATVFFLVKSLRGAIDVISEPGSGSSFSVILPLAETYSDATSADAKKESKEESKKQDRADAHSRIDFRKNTPTSEEASSGWLSPANISSGSTPAASNTPSPQSIKPEQKSKEIPSNKGTQGRILVVDDEDAVRMVLQKSLELLGYDVIAAENGNEALSLFQENPQSVALVVMDMIMPQMPGHVLFYELQKLAPRVKVLISSGYSSDAKTQDLLSNGAVGFIQKPFAIEELAQEVERCLFLEDVEG